MKSICLFIITLIFFASCTCPPKLADGTRPPCKYVGPAISGNIGFQGVTIGLTLWGDVTPKAPLVEIPINKHDPEPIYSK